MFINEIWYYKDSAIIFANQGKLGLGIIVSAELMLKRWINGECSET